MPKVRGTIVSILALVSSVPLAINAFDEVPHQTITRQALSAIHATIRGKPRTFSKYAINQVNDANDLTDSIWRRNAAYWHQEWHFTDEAFDRSTTSLQILRYEILGALRRARPDGKAARKKLGRALHGIQDFYSHSNWVELGNRDIAPGFGITILPNPSRDLHACPSDPNVLGPNGGGGLTSGYYVGRFGCEQAPP